MKVVVVVLAGVMGLAAVIAVPEVARPLASVGLMGDTEREHRIFAFYTTTSSKALATVTITALSTCVSTVAGTPCTGRKKKAIIDNMQIFVDDSLNTGTLSLSGSQVNDDEDLGIQMERQEREVVNERDGKKLTIWSTNISTLTLTSTSYVAGTTVTISALCAAPGVTQGCFGK
ncbi:uncharacterized protein LOC121861160 [Homarus americanus]|uniref:Uncharacterized protein n=1 Tax=Homarus americanus TaxID=6706 RepID=A0A8J5N475_HOMAM|nr:uncharacterized protein LOC121861160 [Homarus americanus]KAG7173113.1 hypothetical protein Hamer_G008639 [Homarus americanus]